MCSILELSNIDYIYHTKEGETKALSNISCTLSNGEFVAIVGPSGCGKSTLLSAVSLSHPVAAFPSWDTPSSQRIS